MGKGGDRKDGGTSDRYQLSNVNGGFYYPKITLCDDIWERKYVPLSYTYTTTKYSRFYTRSYL